MRDEQIIYQLTDWLEEQLEHELTMDMLAARSGYGKTQLQVKFKKVMGKNAMTYIRERRLCNAAIMLMLTKTPVKDIAEKFRFHSQQGFSSVFKKHFTLTPSEFRQRPPNYSLFEPSSYRRKEHVYFFDIIEIEDIPIDGKSRALTMDILSELHKDCVSRKINQQVRHFQTSVKKPAGYIYNVIDYRPSDVKFGHLEIKYTIGCQRMETLKASTTITAGRYVRAIYAGNWQGYVHFSRKVYSHVLPQLHLTRRPGSDFEVYHFAGTSPCEENDYFIVEYCIPVLDRA